MEDAVSYPQEIPDEQNEVVAAFYCHKFDRKKARKAIKNIADEAMKTDGVASDVAEAINDIPLHSKAGVVKNMLIVVNPNNRPIFVVDMRDGTTRHLTYTTPPTSTAPVEENTHAIVTE